MLFLCGMHMYQFGKKGVMNTNEVSIKYTKEMLNSSLGNAGNNGNGNGCPPPQGTPVGVSGNSHASKGNV